MFNDFLPLHRSTRPALCTFSVLYIMYCRTVIIIVPHSAANGCSVQWANRKKTCKSSLVIRKKRIYLTWWNERLCAFSLSASANEKLKNMIWISKVIIYHRLMDNERMYPCHVDDLMENCSQFDVHSPFRIVINFLNSHLNGHYLRG